MEGPLVEKAIDGTILPGEEVRALRTLLRPIFKLDTSSLDVALALVLYSSADYRLQDIGQAFLQGIGITDEDRGQFGFLTTSGNSRVVIKGFDRLIAFSGKVSVVAVDQLDGLIAVTAHGDGAVLRDTVATGLMDFAQDCEHTLIIVSCFMSSWRNIEQAVELARYRFPVLLQLKAIPSPAVGKALIAAYFAKGFAQANFQPAYPTWPIHPDAFATAQEYTPRGLLLVAEEHIRRCREAGRVKELRALNEVGDPGETPQAPAVQQVLTLNLDAEFEIGKQNADVKTCLEETTVDATLPELLSAGLAAFAEENPEQGPFAIDPLPGRNPPLHARIRKIIDPDTKSETHVSFRAIHNVDARAALNRLRSAVVTSGLNLGSQRKLYILRSRPWSGGQATQTAVGDFNKQGGKTLPLDEETLKIFSALRALRERHGENLGPWLKLGGRLVFRRCLLRYLGNRPVLRLRTQSLPRRR